MKVYPADRLNCFEIRILSKFIDFYSKIFTNTTDSNVMYAKAAKVSGAVEVYTFVIHFVSVILWFILFTT